MAAPRGTMPPNAGKGRPKGTPNRATADVRATIALIAERNAERLETWLARVARKNPDRAADLYLRMIEYHIPKLARTEVTGKDGEELRVRVIDLTGVKRDAGA